MPLEIVINGWGPVRTFEDFVDFCMWKAKGSTEPLDRVVMNALLTYYPSFYKAVADPHLGLPRHPLMYTPGSRAAYQTLDTHVFPYLEKAWND